MTVRTISDTQHTCPVWCLTVVEPGLRHRSPRTDHHPQGSVLAAHDHFAFGLREPAPDPVGLVHGQCVRAALRQHRAARADLLCLGLPTGSGRAALPLGMEEHRAVQPTARATYLPIPDIGDRDREPAGVCHVHHFTCRAPCARLSPEVRNPIVTAPNVVHKSAVCPSRRIGLPPPCPGAAR